MRNSGSRYPRKEPQKCVQKRTFDTPKNAWSSGGIQNTSRIRNTVRNPLRASASSYRRKRAGMLRATHSRATSRAKEKPTMLASIVPVSESAKASGQGQMSGAAMTKTVPGMPKGCSVA